MYLHGIYGPELSTKNNYCPHSSVSLGPYCDKISCNMNTIKEYETFSGLL